MFNNYLVQNLLSVQSKRTENQKEIVSDILANESNTSGIEYANNNLESNKNYQILVIKKHCYEILPNVI